MKCGRCRIRKAERDGLCRACRMEEFGREKRKYLFTSSLEKELRRAYQLDGPDMTAALDRLMENTGWPRVVFWKEARRLNLTQDRKPWSREDLEYLQEHAGAVHISHLARHLKRSEHSIRRKAQQVGVSRRPREGYTISDLSLVFQVSAQKVRGWMSRGLFGRVRMHGGKRVGEAAVLTFLRRHSFEYDLQRVDEAWFKSVVFGGESPDVPARSIAGDGEDNGD